MSKKNLCISEQIRYLENSKNIIISDLDEAYCVLEKVGYINIISPYKHYFHVGKENNKHTYPTSIEIMEYTKKYEEDKMISLAIRENIYEYEKLIKTHIADALSAMYSDIKYTSTIKEKIIEMLEYNISLLDNNLNSKAQIKVTFLKNLRDKFKNNSNEEYYLIMNKLQFGDLKTFKDLIPNKYRTSELKYFFTHGDTLRIIRNNLSHSSFIQVYLNGLDKGLFKKNMLTIKRLEKVIRFPMRVDMNCLYNSYNKYHKFK